MTGKNAARANCMACVSSSTQLLITKPAERERGKEKNSNKEVDKEGQTKHHSCKKAHTHTQTKTQNKLDDSKVTIRERKD
jgi:hypothetical protein